MAPRHGLEPRRNEFFGNQQVADSTIRHISGISRNRRHSYSIRTRWEAASMPCGTRSDHLESDEHYLWLVATIALARPLLDLNGVRERAQVTLLQCEAT